MELNWNFQRGGEVLRKIHSVGEVWILLELHIIDCQWMTDRWMDRLIV